MVKMGMGVDQRHDTSLRQISLLRDGGVFRAGGPVRPRSSEAIDPVDDALWLITPVDDDGVTGRRVGDHGAAHLQWTDKEVVNPRFLKAHAPGMQAPFMRLSHPRRESPAHRWSTHPDGPPPATRSDVDPQEA